LKTSKKASHKEKDYANKAKKALEKNDMGAAKVFVEYSVVNRKMATKLLELSCKVETLSLQIKSHSYTNTITRDIANAISVLGTPTLSIDGISCLEQQMDDLIVSSNMVGDVVGDAIGGNNATSAEEKELMETLQDSINYVYELPVAPTANSVTNSQKDKEDIF